MIVTRGIISNSANTIRRLTTESYSQKNFCSSIETSKNFKFSQNHQEFCIFNRYNFQAFNTNSYTTISQLNRIHNVKITTNSILSEDFSDLNKFEKLTAIKMESSSASTSDSLKNTDKLENNTILESKKLNRLSKERSPYLRQHMTNPVDWYPWGEEAFQRARNENKLIFLSVGYSTCHWCHVMERESFENEEIAKIMNEHFINIKVDREERPDVDKVYMNFITATTQRGGWPMSVFLTPDLKPITGGTYFPPNDSRFQIGFPTILKKVAEAWENKREILIKTGDTILETLKKSSETDAQNSDIVQDNIDVPNLKDTVEKCFEQFAMNYDSEFGGWNTQPKFPQPSNFNFLFHVYASNKDTTMGKMALEMCLNTLDKMAKGGIYDHVGDGFCRYSTDNKWHVPHFEKMLYDQGQIVNAYCQAYLETKDKQCEQIIRNVLKYVSRDLSYIDSETNTPGGFYSAEDADSYPFVGAKSKVEGAFYVWEYDYLNDLLKDRSCKNILYFDIFTYHFNVKKNGNCDETFDPHGELIQKNVLINLGSIEDTAEKFQLSESELLNVLDECKQILYEHRIKTRPRPHLDNKIITAWNGLMISGYAKAGYVLNDNDIINRAVQAAQFIKTHLYDDESNELKRSCYVNDDGKIIQLENSINGFLEDYAFLIKGLIDLYEATFNCSWLQWAEILQDTQDKLFWDNKNGGYFQSPENDENIIMRVKEDQDGAEPNGNSVAVQNLLRIKGYLERSDFKIKAGQILTSFKDRLIKIPISLPEMMSAFISYHEELTHIYIAGPKDDPATMELLNVARNRLNPNRLLAIVDKCSSNDSDILLKRCEVITRLKTIGGHPAAYVCRNYSCNLPVTQPNELEKLLDE